MPDPKPYNARDVMRIAIACDTTERLVRSVLAGGDVTTSRVRGRVYRYLASEGLTDLIAAPAEAT